MLRSEAFDPLRALRAAWALLQRAPLPLWLGGVLLVLVSNASDVSVQWEVEQRDLAESLRRIAWLLLPLTALGGLVALIQTALSAWLMTGFFRAVRRTMDDEEEVRVEELFVFDWSWLGVLLTLLLQLALHFATWLPAWLAIGFVVLVGGALDLADGVLVAGCVLAGLAYLPVLVYVGLGLTLMPYPAALEGAGPVTSLRRSWELASGVRLHLLLLALVSFAVACLGLLLCCIGVIPAMALTAVAWSEAYVQASRAEDAAPL